MDPVLLCRAFFVLGAATSLAGTLFPSFRSKIMNYGSRNTTSDASTTKISLNSFKGLFDYIASIQVPHSWFIHYYVASVLSSIFWAHQILTRGRAFELLRSQTENASSGNMDLDRAHLGWLLMGIQGIRRLYECIIFAKPSQSKMWVGLWLIGIGYYIVMGISVWIEGSSALGQAGTQIIPAIAVPSSKTLVASFVFLAASLTQHICHRHLASLKKYTLPSHTLFQWVLCPHYTSECFVYLAIALVAAPKGDVFNKTVFTGLGFVMANLAVTADSTKQWYIEKFGEKRVHGRWRMLPFIY